MRMPSPGRLVATVLAVVSLLPAQGRPPLPRADGAPAMVATERYLFVVRGDVLYQFDIDTLQVRHRFRFPADGKLPAAATAEVEVAEMVAIEEPPPPPPPAVELPPARSAEEIGAAIDAALTWLKVHQDEDGKWDCDGFMKHDLQGAPSDGPGNAVHDVGVTGLAVLAFLGNGSTMRSGPHKNQIKQAIVWLRNQQQHNGLFGVNASHDFVYDHAIATFAVCEAYGLSDYQLLKDTAQKGINYLESHRNPYAVWRYQPRDNDNDTSVTTWAALAFVSGDFFGLQVNQQALQLVSVWYDQVTSPDGRAGYTKAGEPSSRMPGDHATRFPPQNGETLTAAAAFGRLALGQTPEQKPILKAAAELLLRKPPRWEPGHVDAVYWYFGSLAMWQMGGVYRDTWSRALGVLVDQQRRDGNFAGSWDPIGVWDQAGGRVFVTSLYALSLAAPRRLARSR